MLWFFMGLGLINQPHCYPNGRKKSRGEEIAMR